MTPVLAATGQQFEERAEAGAPSAPPPPPSTSTMVFHSGEGAWMKVDTTGLWTTSTPVAGLAPTGAKMWINDGHGFVKADDNTGTGGQRKWNFTQPTSGTPIPPWYLMPPGTFTFALKSADGATTYYTATVDCIWRGYPFKARTDRISRIQGSNAIPEGSPPVTGFFTGWPSIEAALPNPDDTAPFGTFYALHNGYSIVPDASNPNYTPPLAPGNGLPDLSSSTGCVFCVIPGDNPGSQLTGGNASDTRAELTFLQSTYDALGSTTGRSGSPPGGINVMGEADWTPRVYRYDFEFPASWTAPVQLQNNTGPWALTPVGSGPGIYPVKPGTGGYPPGSPGATTNVVNDVLVGTGAGGANPDQFNSLANLMDNQGPSVFVWSGGNGVGKVAFKFVAYAMGQSLRTVIIDTINVTLDTGDHLHKYCTIVEYLPAYFATGNGVPWYQTSAPPVGSPVDQQMIPSGSNQTLYPFTPYGMPLQADGLTPNPPFGGGYFRTWRLIGGVWKCQSAGLPNAVPGTPTIATVGGVLTIIGDTTPQTVNGVLYPSGFGADAGKVFGPTLKCNGGTLSGTIASGTAAPFTLTIASTALPSGFHTNDVIYVKGEAMAYTGTPSYNSGTKVTTFNVTARAQRGTTAVSHANGEPVVGQTAPLEFAPGVIQSTSILVKPFCARSWPLQIGPTFASVSAAPGP